MCESKEPPTLCFIGHRLAPRSSLQSHSPGVFSQCSPWDLTDPQPVTSSRPAVVKVLPDVPLTQPTSEYQSEASPFIFPKPPKDFLSLYPGIRSEFQIRIRVSVWITCIRYLLKHISPSLFLLWSFAGPLKDVLSRVLLLLSPGDEWHIRDSLQLIPSFMLCESKLRACSPFALYLLSFEIIVNVMLDVRWELAAFLNFTHSLMCLSETEGTQTSKQDKNSSSQAVGYCWSCSRK